MMKIKYIFVLVIFAILSTGCLLSDSMEDITIYTTSYPIEYITNRLYGEHSEIKSIYPDGMQEGYKVSDKLIEDYSKGDLFIFNGLMEYYELDTEGKLVLENNLPNLVSVTIGNDCFLSKDNSVKCSFIISNCMNIEKRPFGLLIR